MPKAKIRKQGFNYSLGDLLEFMLYISFALATVKAYGWFGSACVLIGIAGAATASFRIHYPGKRVIGAILALYGAYAAIFLFSIFDDILLNKSDITPIWWIGPSTTLAGMLLAFSICGAICGAIFARRMCKNNYRIDA